MTSNIIQLTTEQIPQLVTIEQNAHISPWSKGMFETAFNARCFNFALSVSEGEQQKIVGYVIAEIVAGEVTLHNICVAKGQQGQGYSTILMQHFIEKSKSLNGEDIWLEVRRSNNVAIQLYKKFGFIDQGVRKGYYAIPLQMQNDEGEIREDALLMSLKLN